MLKMLFAHHAGLARDPLRCVQPALRDLPTLFLLSRLTLTTRSDVTSAGSGKLEELRLSSQLLLGLSGQVPEGKYLPQTNCLPSTSAFPFWFCPVRSCPSERFSTPSCHPLHLLVGRETVGKSQKSLRPCSFVGPWLLECPAYPALW